MERMTRNPMTTTTMMRKWMSRVFIDPFSGRLSRENCARNDCRAAPWEFTHVFYCKFQNFVLLSRQRNRPAGSPVKNVTVFQVDYVRKTKVPIGKVIERRTKERGDNILGLLRLARKAYASSPEEALNIAIDARGAWAS